MSFSLDDDYDTNWRDDQRAQRRLWWLLTIGVVAVCVLAYCSTKH